MAIRNLDAAGPKISRLKRSRTATVIDEYADITKLAKEIKECSILSPNESADKWLEREAR